MKIRPADSTKWYADNGDGTYEIKFDDGKFQEVKLAELKTFFPCDCDKLTFNTNIVILNALANGPDCVFPIKAFQDVHVL